MDLAQETACEFICLVSLFNFSCHNKSNLLLLHLYLIIPPQANTMRLSLFAIAFASATIAIPAHAADLATTADLQTLSNEIVKTEEEINAEIKILEAGLDEYETTTDGTATRTIDDGSAEPTETTTEDKTLTTTLIDCPVQPMVECKISEEKVTREVEGCGTYYECYCAGSVVDPTSCPAGVVETHDDTNDCTPMQCVEKTCDRITAYSLVEDCPMGSSLHFVEEACSYECQKCENKCPYGAQVMTFTTLNSCDMMCSCPTASCPTGQILVSREADCSINCQTPCTPPTCADGEYLVEIDGGTCTYECHKLRNNRNGGGGGGKKKTSDADGTTTKPCRGKICRRKNLRA